jgi:menaquinol-cytochrome c reductase cytochrome b/c subunit
MAEVPEHLLKRSRERRKALGLPVDGEEDAPAADAPDAGGDAGGEAAAPAEEAAPVAASADAGEEITESVGGVPAALLERSRKRKAALAGGGGGPAPAGGGGTATATLPRAAAVTAPAPSGTGPGGHTQRLLTVVKSGSIQQTRADAQDKVHVWPHLLVIEFASILTVTAFLTIFSALVKAPLLGLADVNQTPNPSKAPWYFLGLQELLTMFTPMVAGVMIPGVALIVLMIAPYADKNPSHRPSDRKFAICIFTVFLMFWSILVIIGCFFRGQGFNFTFPWNDHVFFEL